MEMSNMVHNSTTPRVWASNLQIELEPLSVDKLDKCHGEASFQ